jgi:hypothetical protein
VEDENSNIHKFCRSNEYYVNPESEEVIELGTFDYPFRSASLPFVEIFNYFSHSGKNVTINLAEGAVHKMNYEGHIILNTPLVTVQPYSPSGNPSTSKAHLLIKGDIQSVFSSFAKFNIIKNQNLKESVYTLSENVTMTERNAVLASSGMIFTVIISNFNIFNVTIKSKKLCKIGVSFKFGVILIFKFVPNLNYLALKTIITLT